MWHKGTGVQMRDAYVHSHRRGCRETQGSGVSLRTADSPRVLFLVSDSTHFRG